MYANNETGVVFPLHEIGEIAHERGIFLHTDGVQAVGKIKLDMSRLPVDLISFSGHKFHAPKGIGGLYVRRGTKIRPFIIGGHQERSRRGGTENTPYIVAMGAAAALVQRNLPDEETRVRALRDKLEQGILSQIKNTEINGDPDNRVPNTTNIGIHFIEGEALLLALDKHHIAASTGSACASGSLQPSHVLRSMGIPFTSIHGSLRLSLSVYNTEQEIDYVVQVLPEIVDRLRQLSPFHSMKDVEVFGTRADGTQEHPVVVPQVTHFKHVPLRTSVKCPHTAQASPSYPCILATAPASNSASAPLSPWFDSAV
jgi:cysteine desulfurase